MIAGRMLAVCIDTDTLCAQSALLTCCPESPVWLRWRGRHAEAHGVERRLSMPESDGHTDQRASCEALLPSDSEAPQQAVSGLQLQRSTLWHGQPQQTTTLVLLPVQAAADTSWRVLLSPSSRYANMMLLAIGVPLTQQVRCTANSFH
jgi:hypothetical protein